MKFRLVEENILQEKIDSKSLVRILLYIAKIYFPDNPIVNEDPTNIEIHHEDLDDKNNDPTNLYLVTKRDHSFIHSLAKQRDDSGRYKPITDDNRATYSTDVKMNLHSKEIKVGSKKIKINYLRISDIIIALQGAISNMEGETLNEN